MRCTFIDLITPEARPVAGKDRKKELARQRYQRQQARRRAQEARARRVRIIGSVVAVAVIAGGVGGMMAFTGRDDDSNASASTSPSPGGEPQDGAPKQAISLQRVTVKGKKGGGTASCKYPKSQTDQGAPKKLGSPPSKAAYKGTVDATIKTELGDVTVELDAAKAPCTVNSFAFLAEKRFYEKSKCHRLTSGGLNVLQCGDPTGGGTGGPGYRYANENTKGAKYTRGTLAMAHSQMPDSNGSQFFIVYKDSQLDPDYTVFGKITTGMDVIDKVAKAGVAAQ
jgi:peptidyl-prolyl cis-trans isomerase B (cyclophilin B)